jgi:hypothetical protein
VLDLLRRELRAANVYLEFGGTARLEPTVLSQPLDEHWRVVAVFTEPPPADARDRLAALLEAFSSVRPSLTPVARTLGRPPAERRLDEELQRLQELLGAKVALIIDDSSPMIWGSSALRSHGIDIDFLLDLASVADNLDGEQLALLARDLGDPNAKRAAASAPQRDRDMDKLRDYAPALVVEDWYIAVLSSLAVAPFRRGRDRVHRGRQVIQPQPVGYVAQPLASQYMLLFVFDEAFSQLHAEATAVHAAPHLEKLIAELPPVDPGGGARAVRKPKLKLV